MISYEIKRPKRPKQERPTLTLLTEADGQPEQLSRKERKKKEIFDEQFTAFWADIGDKVEFKHSTKNRIEWTVSQVERDYRVCRWTKGGTKPLFIELKRTIYLDGNRQREETVWTHTDALKQPKGKGNWK